MLVAIHDREERSTEVLESRGGNDDGVPSSIDVFGNPKETASLIFLEIEEEDFPLHRDFFTVQCVLHFNRCP